MRGSEAMSGPAAATMLMVGLAAALMLLVPEGTSGDLRAFWLAGQFFAEGDLNSVYPPAAPVFTLDVPPAWIGTGDDASLYPFIYPPIWAALAAWLGQITSFPDFAFAMHKINAGLMVATVALAWRATGAQMPLALFTILGTVMLGASFVGVLGLMENQPQILVSFLIVLALERSRSAAPMAAGIALALAASIKGYPALFALLWLAAGQRKEAAAFLISGAAIGGLSVALTGWALHATFLGQLATISNTILLTPVSYALAPFITQVFAPDLLAVSETAHGPAFRVGAMPLLAGILAKAALVLVLVILSIAMRRANRDTRDAMLWPLTLTAVSLLSPLAWSYHYIAAVAAAPVLIDRFGPRLGGGLLLTITLPLTGPAIALYLHAGPLLAPAQAVGTILMLALASAFAMGARTPRLAGSVPKPA